MKKEWIYLLVGLSVGVLLAIGWNYGFGDHPELVQLKKERLGQKEIGLKEARAALTVAKKEESSEVKAAIKGGGEEDRPVSRIIPLQSTKPVDEKAGFMKSLVERQITQQQEGKLLSLKSRLNLTADQELKIKAFLEEEGKRMVQMSSRFMQGESLMNKKETDEFINVKTIDQILEETLSPEQKSGYEVMKKDEKKSSIELMTTLEMSQVAPTLGLDETQKDQFYNAIYQVEESMGDPEKIKKIIEKEGATASDFLTIKDQAKLDVVKSILNPAQLDIYKKHLETKTSSMKAMMEQVSPAKEEQGTLTVPQ